MTTLSGSALRHASATRYVMPLREGGSLPALVEADDLGMYVVKFREAGQGRKVLVAEIVVAGLATAIGLSVPDLVLMDIPAEMAPAEPDQEVQDLLRASAGLNLGVDYLPGSLGFNPVVDPVGPEEAAAVVWLDALTLNVDRSWRNPNLLCWHGRMWLIDHGAALYFAHNWPTAHAAAARPYVQASDHILLRAAGDLLAADAILAPLLTDDVLRGALAAVPDAWMADEPGFASPDAVREAYVGVLSDRLAHRENWVTDLEATRAAV